MEIPAMVAAWRDAWQSLVLERIANLYAPDATHMSGAVVERMKRADGTLKGPEELRIYAQAVRGQIASFRADILNVISSETAGGGHAAVEYWRVVDGDEAGRKRVLEIIEWQNDKIVACRVFHF